MNNQTNNQTLNNQTMNNQTVKINYTLDIIDDVNIDVNLNGFILNYNSIDYIITLHNYGPVYNIKIGNTDANILINSSCNILINSSWNELLILENNLETPVNQKIKNVKLGLPEISQELYCNNDKYTVYGYSFNNINNIPLYPRILYIKIKCDADNIKNIVGSPVFQKDGKLVGILANTIYDDFVYVLPSYYIIKTLQKECNDKIYKINHNSINKINKYIVNNNSIYHNTLGIRVPLDVYTTLEGDENKMVIINKNEEQRYIEINMPNISNERFLKKENENYIVNAALLITLKVINNRITSNFINFVKSHLNEKILLNIKKNELSNDIGNLSLDDLNVINQQITINNQIYDFKMFF